MVFTRNEGMRPASEEIHATAFMENLVTVLPREEMKPGMASATAFITDSSMRPASSSSSAAEFSSTGSTSFV